MDELDNRQSPIGFYLLGLSYFDAADRLTAQVEDQAEAFRLRFDLPIRHLYAHGWELCLKACLFRQGIKPSVFRRRAFGHSLSAAWERIDRQRFAALNLKDELADVLTLLDQFHPTKMYAYPVTGFRNEVTLTFLRAASSRFKISRQQIAELFGPL